jgi:hypothetical protein|tara:strand:+ start:2299 stop:3168 length:870 start_codon:yes stop_codon:yes gene_type:complete
MRKLIQLIFIVLLLSGCGLQFQYSTLNTAGNIDGIYRTNDYTIVVPDSTKIDTISNLFQLRRKLRTDFNFRWDFAQYMSNQPYSMYWYNRHPRYNGIWYPQTSFDFYFNSHQYWNDWAFNYPWFGYYHPYRVRHHRYYQWYYPHPQGWYSWNHYGYSHYTEPLIASTNYSFVNGYRGSRIQNIQDTNRVNRVRPNSNANREINNVIRWSRDNNIPVNNYVVPQDGTRYIKPTDTNNNIRVNPPSNNNNNNWTPRQNPTRINTSTPVIRNNSSRSSGGRSNVSSSKRGGN